MSGREEQPTSATLDGAWIQELRQKRATGRSSVACVVTVDPVRSLQIKAYVAACGDYSAPQIHWYTPWKGLQRLTPRGSASFDFQPVTQQGGEYAQMAGVENQLIELSQALRYMDRLFRRQRCVLLLENLDEPRNEDKERHLLYALRDWAHDPELLRNGSLILLIVGSVSRVLDDFTKRNAVVVEPPIGAEADRLYIIDSTSSELGVSLSQADRATIARTTSGMNLHQLQTSLRESHQSTGALDIPTLVGLKNQFIRESDLVEVAEPAPEGFASIGGYQAAKDFVMERIVRVLNRPERASALRKPLPRGFILFGPPGTGKSAFARALAGEISLPIVILHTERLWSSLVGESGHRFRAVIDLVEQMGPVIVFVDEIEKLLMKRRGESTDSASYEFRNVTNQVLEWLGSKERKTILVGATNRPEDFDRASIRAQRVDYLVPMLYPDIAARAQILRVHLRLTPGNASDFMTATPEEIENAVRTVAEQTDGFSGAELEQLVNDAKDYAFDSEPDLVKPGDLIEALQAFRIDRAEREAERRRYQDLAARFTRHSEFLE